MSPDVRLEPVDAGNRADVIRLRVTEAQRGFLDTQSLEEFLDDAPNHPTFAPYAMRAGGEVVGFMSLGCLPDEPTRAWIPLIIVDVSRQRRGYGRAALLLAIDRAREVLGASAIGLAYKPENLVAAKLYAALGFVADAAPDESGEIPAWLPLG